MAAFMLKFLFGLLTVSIAMLMVFLLLAWIASRIFGASIKFQFGGWTSLRDIDVQLKKGAVEYISISEIKLGFSLMLKDPKLQILICGLEVVTRPSSKGPPKAKKKRKPRSPGKKSSGKLIILAKMARFFSLSVKDIVIKTPKATSQVKEVKVDISKDGGLIPSFSFNLNILPISVHIGEQQSSCDQPSNPLNESGTPTSQCLLPKTEKPFLPFSCEGFSISCEFGRDREAGLAIQNVDINLGEISLNLNEELVSKKKKSSDVSSQTDKVAPTIDSTVIDEPQKDQVAVSPLTKYTSMFPEKVCFNLPKINLGFTHREIDAAVENNITGIQFKIMKSQSTEDGGEKTCLDVQMDFSEIHILREANTSLLEIKKIDIVSFLHIPMQPTAPIRAEIDVKLGGTQSNVIITRLTPWLRMQSSKKKSMVLKEETPKVEKPKSAGSKKFAWTCTVSAPEMKITLYNINGLPLYHACSQSTNVFANNTSTAGIAVHMELGELNLFMEDEHQDCLKESLLSVEPNSGSLLHVVKISLDWGKKDMDTSHDAIDRFKLALSINVTGMGIYFTFKRVETLIVAALSFQALLKPLLGGKKSTQKQAGHASKSSGKGMRLLKFNLERCSVNFFGEASLEGAVVPDPKRVNYGSQGGRFVISVSADGTERTATVMSTVSDVCKRLKYSVSLDIFHLSLCVNKEKQSKQLELERAKSMYQEYQEEDKPCTKVALFDIQNAKFVQRSGGLKEIAVCSLFSATDITVRWEPDVHLSLFELGLQLKQLVRNQKLEQLGNKQMGEPSSMQDEPKKESPMLESGNAEKQKKKESIFALDVELITISAEAGDGVEALVQIQSIFSENARIGVLLEGLMLCFCGARLVKSSRMQISRIPSTSIGSSEGTIWDWRVQALDVHICLPYRLQLRAIDDAVEEMLRALKLVTAAQTKLICPVKKASSSSKKPSSKKFGRLRLCVRKLTADIEEEPLQGWLDEHYHLMKREASELAVRLELFDDFISANQCPKTDEVTVATSEKKVIYDGVEIDVQDPSAIQKLREDLYRQSFQSYYRACQKLAQSEGSGACREGFQAGFKPSVTRTSVLSLSATDFDVTLTMIDGGEDGMIEVVKKLDPVCRENNIPFSRLYGGNILLDTGTLDVLLRDYTFPLFAATRGKCEGRLVLAQQATAFQPQMSHEVYIGKWRKVQLLRSLTGTTPPMKTYLDLPIFFQTGIVSYGVGYEPVFADVSYAFTVALRRAHLSLRGPEVPLPPKKEKSLPWWDEMRNYIHGNTTLFFSETKFHILATTDPYEKVNELQIVSGSMEIQQSDGRIYLSAKDFRIYLSSLESMINNPNLKLPAGVCGAFLAAPVFIVEVLMDWECESGHPLNHFLFSLPVEGKARDKVYDPFRSTGLSLRWNFSLRPLPPTSETQPPSASKAVSNVQDGANPGSNNSDNSSTASLTLSVGAHDLAWMIKFCYMMYLPPHKLRFFSRWPRFGVPRIPRSGNLSLDRVMTDVMLRFDAMATCIKHMPLHDDDPAKGLTFTMTKLKYEMYSSRCQQKYTFECFRDPLDLVYQGVDLHMLKAFFDKENCDSVAKLVQIARKGPQTAAPIENNSSANSNTVGGSGEKHRDDGFFISSEYFTIRRQAPKADSAKLLAWQEASKKDMESTNVRSEIKNGNDGDENARSDPSDDEGLDVVIADNCQRVSVCGLKLLWNIENRDAVWSWVGGLSKAFEAQKRSPSRQYTQRKLLEEKQQASESEKPQEDTNKTSSTSEGVQSSTQQVEASGSQSSPLPPAKLENPSTPPVAPATNDIVTGSEEEGTLHFMVNVIEPQFNLHSEEANGRFLLAAASGRVLARSFHSVLQVGSEMIEQALGTESVQNPEQAPEMTWKRMEFSVMLEHVQAHVAPTDVDPGAGIQWLPRIRRKSPRVKRTGALLERVFMPCDMFFRYTRHAGWSPDLKVKPLKELAFNSHDITATMTSRQFQVMLDVLTNLLFARVPKPRKSSLTFPGEDEEDMGEEADEVVPDGVEEVELARIALERKEQKRKLLLGDIKKLSIHSDSSDPNPEKEADLWMITGGRSILVQGLKKELVNARKARKEASASLRVALQKAAQIRLMEKEKNKSPSYAMRVSVQITKVAWSMLLDGKPIAETEIHDMIYDFERDYRDVGVAQFTTKFFVVRNCLPNAKSDTLLSPWNPPPEWGKKVMLRVDAKQGAPKDGNSTLELFQVEIFPLKIHLTETMYRMMWGYLFPEEEQDSLRRQEVWKVSTTVGARRGKKGSIDPLALAKDFDVSSKSGTSSPSQTANADSAQALKSPKSKANVAGLRRTSSFDRSWEETVAESIANELVLQANKSDSLIEQPDEPSKSKAKDSKTAKSGKPAPEDKKVGKSTEEKKPVRPRKMMEFHNIKISQVELLVTYEGSRFVVSDLKLLMDTFHRVEFTGTWRRLFSRVKKHIIWGVLKSVTGMQGKKFKDKGNTQKEPAAIAAPDSDLTLSDNDQSGKSDQAITFMKRPNDGAGDGFVTSIKGLFSNQRRKAKAFVLRTMRGEENDFSGEWSDNEADFSPLSRQMTINKTKKLIRRHTKKFRSKKGSSSQPTSPTGAEGAHYESESSSGSPAYEEFLEENFPEMNKNLPETNKNLPETSKSPTETTKTT